MGAHLLKVENFGKLSGLWMTRNTQGIDPVALFEVVRYPRVLCDVPICHRDLAAIQSLQPVVGRPAHDAHESLVPVAAVRLPDIQFDHALVISLVAVAAERRQVLGSVGATVPALH